MLTQSGRRLYTIGHSTHSAEAFLRLLRAWEIATVVDVRRYPGSQRHPQFGRGALEAVLGDVGIEYRHEPELGGRRRASSASPHRGLRSKGLRGYADHPRPVGYRRALARLVATALERATAIMCVEAVPWRCHRQLISDQLVFDGFDVQHILGVHRIEPHCIHPTARPGPHGVLVYPPESPQTHLFDG